ncbi:uncharacterized protein [Diadema setosum]|uniref:uncharacterized protein n=1 Tax=Diadema setosum TaxID=31175 RepID=UPI003B3BA01C
MTFPEIMENIRVLEDDKMPTEDCSLLDEGSPPLYGTTCASHVAKSFCQTKLPTNDHSLDDDDDDDVPRKWPLTIRVVLCALGLWLKDDMKRTSFTNSCDHNGSSTNNAVPLRSKIGLCSDILAFAYLVLTSGLLGYDMTWYLLIFWGKQSDLLHLVSYLTFLLQVTAIPVWCLYARIRYRKVNHGTTSCYPMNQAYVARRVAMLSKCRSGKNALSCLCLAAFIAWPLINATIRLIYDYLYPSCSTHRPHEEISHWVAVPGYLFYGSFCYLIYVERVSFEAEILYIARFAQTQAPEQNVRNVRAKIRLFYEHYAVLREQINAWMAFTMVIATWGLTAHITWNYLIFTSIAENGKSESLNKDHIQNIRFLNILVGCQKIMFFVLPCIALGGLNLEHVWRNLKVTIVKYRDSRFESFWMIIHRYVVDINAGWHREIMPTLIFSAIGFYLGLNLGSDNQNTDFWSGRMNCTVNITTIPL